MIEADLEKIVVDSLKAALEGYDTQVYGTWQPADGVKSEEEDGVESVLTVKAFPRSYDTPTVPYAGFSFQVALVVRSDVDFDGKDYIQITDAVSNKLQQWQKNYESYHGEFSTNSFDPTGFQLDGGDCGIDKASCVWTYVQNFTLYGIIK